MGQLFTMVANISIEKKCGRVSRKNQMQMPIFFINNAAFVNYLFCADKLVTDRLYIDYGSFLCSYFSYGTC